MLTPCVRGCGSYSPLTDVCIVCRTKKSRLKLFVPILPRRKLAFERQTKKSSLKKHFRPGDSNDTQRNNTTEKKELSAGERLEMIKASTTNATGVGGTSKKGVSFASVLEVHSDQQQEQLSSKSILAGSKTKIMKRPRTSIMKHKKNQQ